MSKIESDYKDMSAVFERREKAMRNAPPCPDCETNQVELIIYTSDLNKWKCRRCGNRWESNV